MADDEPELATNEEWRGIMVRARKEHGLSQAELGAKVGCSQVMISKIESDDVASNSSRILAICEVLKIPPPQHFENEEIKSWVQLGRLLRAKNRSQYKFVLQLVESMAKEAAESAPGPDSESGRDRTVPDRRK